MSTHSSVIAITESVIRTLDKVVVLHDPPASVATDGKFAPLGVSSLHPAIADLVRKSYPRGLFTHQHQAIEHVLAGRHTVTATRTSSGKSLTFALPALHSICQDPASTALFLYPQKALASDQLQKLNALTEQLDATASLVRANPMFVSRYDGSIETPKRKLIRDKVQLLATNPDMLHEAILQYHGSLWSRFFSNLEIVAIDECHDYRGAFGSHVAMVLRRLREICRIHGSAPVFTASSATIAEPQTHLEKLTGLNFELVGADADGSRQGRGKLWVLGGSQQHHEIGRRLAVKLAKAGLRVLVFCSSRSSAEKMLCSMRAADGIPPKQLAVYKAGLTAAERAEIERGLDDGTKRLVFSTNALELGIDVGHLDAVICVGLPATSMSLWQRAGRVGRSGREGAVILIPGNTPIDSHYAQRPAEFLSKGSEPIAININNERIVTRHYACAIAEQGRDASSVDAATLGPMAVRIKELRDRGGVIGVDEFLTNKPHSMVNLRGIGDECYSLVCSGDKIGEISRSQLLREAPPSAIYRHAGRAYRVQSVDSHSRCVRLVREQTRNETCSFVRKVLTLEGASRRLIYRSAEVAIGRLEVSEYLESLTERDPTGQVRNGWSRPGGLPQCRLKTEGTLIIIKEPMRCELQRKLGARYPVAAESAERLLAGLFPTVAGPCDPQDFSSGMLTTGEGDPAIVLYDTAPGGIGLTEAVYRHAEELIGKAIDRVQRCECKNDAGCIRCVVHPHQDSKSSKVAAIALLQLLQQCLAGGEIAIRESDQDSCPLAVAPPSIQCCECETNLPPNSKYCSNCGNKVEVTNA